MLLRAISHAARPADRPCLLEREIRDVIIAPLRGLAPHAMPWEPPQVKLKHWRGFHGKSGPQGAWMLGFDVFVAGT
ncbi:MAG: hypothetical protein ABI790_13385 [Betaproteobacteria bacterium]